MTFNTARALALVCAFVSLGVPAAAQDAEDPFDTARFRFGPIRFTPAIQITSVGRDSNIFNQAEDPQSDTTAAIGPLVQLWMHPGRTRLSAKVGGQYLYFKKFADQRAWNTSNEARFEAPLSRLTPFIEGTYVNSQERQGYEIDSRSRRRDDSVTAGTSLRVGGKSAFVVSFRRANAKYDENASFLGTELAKALNRQEDRTQVQFRYTLTPLTTFVVDTNMSRDRFAVTNVRDADSVRVMPGFEFKPLALVAGRVFVGYREFKPLSDSLPDYRGVIASVDASYVSRGSTRFQVKVDRDVMYSFEAARPYYALLDFGLTVTQRITPAWEILARGSRQTLRYRLLDAGNSAAPPADRGYIYGAGLGYLLGETFRLGLDVNSYTRRSEFEGRRDYEGVRIFGSISYGIQQ